MLSIKQLKHIIMNENETSMSIMTFNIHINENFLLFVTFKDFQFPKSCFFILDLTHDTLISFIVLLKVMVFQYFFWEKLYLKYRR